MASELCKACEGGRNCINGRYCPTRRRYVEHQDIKECNGKDGKITQDEIAYFISSDGKLPRMNQDQRDALLLAWVCAGYPVKVKPKAQTTLQKTIRAFDG